MSKGQHKPDTVRALAGLKDFQRTTVEYVYHRLYEDTPCAARFLIADEVGLGKTLVARGIIAKAVDKLWQKDNHRIDIIYICANQDIARQNINRLNITDEPIANATRMTLLPLYLHNFQNRKLNLVSFTPGTSFDLQSRGGTAYERVLIYHLLREAWDFGNLAGPKNLFQVTVGRETWHEQLKRFERDKVDTTLRQAFFQTLKENPQVHQDFKRLTDAFGYTRQRKNIDTEERQEQLALIGELRHLLAKSCVRLLEPDIVILDEFQRFKYLLDTDNEMALLAQELFNYQGAKTLLLSATPYKMYTMHHEQMEEDHYADFIRTTGFLFNSEPETQSFQADLRHYREMLFQLNGQPSTELQQVKTSIEHRLRRVMVRTERLFSTVNRDAMVESKTMLGLLTDQDLRAFVTLDQVAQMLEAGDMVEYWKSAPYILNLMDHTGYKVKEKLIQSYQENPSLLAALKEGQDTLLSWETIRTYQPIDPGNAKLRTLLAQTVERGAWQLLWIPASLPYYQPAAGPFTLPELQGFTKALVFSSWQIVPKVIAALCSYEAERQMVTHYIHDMADYVGREKREARLVFNLDNKKQPASMSTLTLLYPCITLATDLDPLQLGMSLAQPDLLPDLEQVKEVVTTKIEQLLAPIVRPYANAGGRVDERWYWVALALLDRRYHSQTVTDWFEGEDEKINWRGMVEGRTQDEDDTNFAAHLDLFYQVFTGEEKTLGRPPGNLSEVLGKIALASPAVITLRALLRFCPVKEHQHVSPSTQAAAAGVALAFRSLFNLPETTALIRSIHSESDTRYWESVLDYSLNGNLQAVMDEYAHILLEALGLVDKPIKEVVQGLAGEMQTALSIRTVNLSFDEIQAKRKVMLDAHNLRCRFALRFGNDKTEDNQAETRADQVRIAFNSPFAPFILATTSIGQEGLDFHQYCHQVYHWNLPSNPVDLEQREGRIHRYKGHVIRRNLAQEFPLAGLNGRVTDLADPWHILFELAKEDCQDKNGMIPYWIFEPKNSQQAYKIQRYIPALPLSRDNQRLDDLRCALVAYRLVFGQPRQEDLVNYLQSRMQRDLKPEDLVQYQIDLSPGTWW